MSDDEQPPEDRLPEDLTEEVPFLDDDTDDEGPADLREVLRRSLITGAAIFIPLAVTFLVIGFVVNFLSNSLQPAVGAVGVIPGVTTDDPVALKLIILGVILVVIPVVGFLAEFSTRGTRLGEEFDDLMTSIPGLGSVYSSFNDMSELLLDSDTESFQDVKLVEYPTEDSYVVAFKTSETPAVVGEATGHDDMATLFMPMAPNPVMGGFVIHVSRDRVVDVDMSVEQGIRSIVTSGVAFGEDGAAVALSAEEMRDLGYADRIEGAVDPSPAQPGDAAADSLDAARPDAYDRNVAPEYADTPDKMAERERPPGHTEPTEETPEELASRAADEREDTTESPEELTGSADGDDGDGEEPPTDGGSS